MYGSAYITNQETDIPLICNNESSAVLVLTDDREQFKYSGFLTVGALLPNYESLSAEVEGRYQEADMYYTMYLNSSTPQRLFAIILAAMHTGKDICFFVPPNESQSFRFAYSLMVYMRNRFGVIVADGLCLQQGFPESPMVDMNPNYEAIRLNLMYNYGVIDIAQYLLCYPSNLYACDKVYKDIMMQYRIPDPNQVVEFTNGLANQIKENAKHNGKFNPLIRLHKQDMSKVEVNIQ